MSCTSGRQASESAPEVLCPSLAYSQLVFLPHRSRLLLVTLMLRIRYLLARSPSA